MLGPFSRAGVPAPILRPDTATTFDDPMTGKPVAWMHDHVFNPGAVVRDGKVDLLVRSEDDSGQGIGMHTSRLGLAESADGLHFTIQTKPVLFPADDNNKAVEWPGGCEDPRIVESGDGRYIVTYTAYDRKTARLCEAESTDLVTWKKDGPVFRGPMRDQWSKSGSIVCEVKGDHLIAKKINGRYWMFYGEGTINVATSGDLVHWGPLPGPDMKPQALFTTRKGKFDSDLVEPGPPAIITKRGIVFLYNGKNAASGGDPSLKAGVYCAGQALLDVHDPGKVLDRCERPFLKPEGQFEVTGQYAAGTVFIEGLVRYKGKWMLYYGAADSYVGAAWAR